MVVVVVVVGVGFIVGVMRCSAGFGPSESSHPTVCRCNGWERSVRVRDSVWTGVVAQWWWMWGMGESAHVSLTMFVDDGGRG